MSRDLGFSRTVTSVASLIRGIEFRIMALLTGYLVDRFGPSRITIAGVLIMVFGMIWMCFVNSLWTYCLVWGLIIASGYTLSLTISIDKALTNWFVSKRGIAFAARFTLISIVTVCILPIIT